MPSRAFGKYEVLARLATGGAASIFLARQGGAAGFTKLVCLKTLLPERAQDEDFVAMFLDEARLAARLNHPNCVQIYDLGRVRGVYYISMEYIFGETLWSLLTTVSKTKMPLPPPHVAHAIASVCDGLQHAHDLKDRDGKAYNLVHRDVSPQNVMISYEGQTKVVDFGIAKAETDRAPTMAGIVKGKFSYMSPEQITGSQVDRRSDIYSLGIVMFECLASRRLYRGETPEDIARLILEHRAPRLSEVLPSIPPQLDAICAKALTRRREHRYQSAYDMAEDLRSYLDEIGYRQSASGLSGLLHERFGDVITARRHAFEAASQMADYDEQELLEALDAVAVREVDLLNEQHEEGPPDFTETALNPVGDVTQSSDAVPAAEVSASEVSPGSAMVELVDALSHVPDSSVDELTESGENDVTEFEPDRGEMAADADSDFDSDSTLNPDVTRADPEPYEDGDPTATESHEKLKGALHEKVDRTGVEDPADPADPAEFDTIGRSNSYVLADDSQSDDPGDFDDMATRVDPGELVQAVPEEDADFHVPEAISMPVVKPMDIAGSTRRAVSPARAFVDEADDTSTRRASAARRQPSLGGPTAQLPTPFKKEENGLTFAPSVVIGALVMGLLIGVIAGLLMGRAVFSDSAPTEIPVPTRGVN